jgi:hypothetical protein
MTYNHHVDELYEKYKYYGFSEDVATLQLIKPIYDRPTNMIKNKIQLFNHCKFEGFYLIRFHSEFLNELKEAMIFFGKDRRQLQDNLFIIYYHLNFGYPKISYNEVKKVIDEYCSVYDNFQKIKFIQRLPELTIYKDMVYMLPIVDIRLSESEYKLLEKFLLKHLSLENIMKIEHYHKRGFLRRI